MTLELVGAACQIQRPTNGFPRSAALPATENSTGRTRTRAILPERPSTLLTGAQWQHVAETLRLSGRELEIVKAVFDCASNTRVSSEIGMPINTVREHFRRLYRKLGINTHLELCLCVLVALRGVEPITESITSECKTRNN